MKKNCKLIATLPSIFSKDKMLRILQCDDVSEVRFNTGVGVPYTPDELIDRLVAICDFYGKKLWIDIKGRQLRITKWSLPRFDCIEISHEIELVSKDSRLLLRGDEELSIKDVKDGNKLYVEPLPTHAVGAGQSINILPMPIIYGYLTTQDKEYLRACKKYGVNNIMASFVESSHDIYEIIRILPEAEVIEKIESRKGVEYIKGAGRFNLMAARDDLYIHLEENYRDMINALGLITMQDHNAICASRIFSSLEKSKGNSIDFSDFIDLEFMYKMGYKNFMLCDNVSNYYFDKAIEAWRCFVNG